MNASDFITQRKYTLDLLKETGKLGCKPARMPLEKNWKQKMTENDPWVNEGQYQRLVSKLIYIFIDRPDIALEVANQVPWYLKGTPDRGIQFWKNEQREVEGFADADWASSMSCKSTIGYRIKLWGNLLHGGAKNKP